MGGIVCIIIERHGVQQNQEWMNARMYVCIWIELVGDMTSLLQFRPTGLIPGPIPGEHTEHKHDRTCPESHTHSPI